MHARANKTRAVSPFTSKTAMEELCSRHIELSRFSATNEIEWDVAVMTPS